MEDVRCPYCEEEIKIEPTDFEHYQEYEEYECERCSKNFEVYAEPTIDYTVCGKADCLNGADHKWKQIVGIPAIHFRGKYRCEDCSAEHEVREELATEEQYDAYFKSLKEE